MKISQIMTTDVQCVRPNNTLVEAAGIMRRMDIGAVPVCGDDDKLIGMLTDRDICLRAVAYGRDPNRTKVSDVLSPGVIYVREEEDVNDAVQTMEKYQIRRLPVMNVHKRLVGIISLGDIATGASNRVSGEALQEVSSPGDSESENPATR